MFEKKVNVKKKPATRLNQGTFAAAETDLVLYKLILIPKDQDISGGKVA